MRMSVWGHPGGELEGFGYGVGGLEGGDDAFGAAEDADGFEGFGIGCRRIRRAASVVEHGVLGADGGVVEAGGDGVCLRDLAGVVLEDVGEGALEDAGQAAAGLLEAGGVFAESVATASGFYSDQLDIFVVEELVEGADGVGASADAGDDGVGEAAFLVEELARGPRSR